MKKKYYKSQINKHINDVNCRLENRLQFFDTIVIYIFQF